MLDVREPSEVGRSVIPGSIAVPLAISRGGWPRCRAIAWSWSTVKVACARLTSRSCTPAAPLSYPLMGSLTIGTTPPYTFYWHMPESSTIWHDLFVG